MHDPRPGLYGFPIVGLKPSLSSANFVTTSVAEPFCKAPRLKRSIHFPDKALRFVFALLTVVLLAPVQAAPNILLIVSDDQGWADLGSNQANQDIATPNLDRLAANGTRFLNAYITAPQCIPSRAGYITGRYQQRFGIEQNGDGFLPLDEITLAERLLEKGYVTGHVGKWHLATKLKDEITNLEESITHTPDKQGFLEYWAGERRWFLASHNLNGKPFGNAPFLVQDNRFRVTVQTEAALAFLDRRSKSKSTPWFLHLSYFTPHVPLESPEPWYSKTPAGLPRARRQALAMMAAMDDGIGKVLAKVKAMGEEQETLVIFLSDNGAPFLKDQVNGSINRPLSGGKGTLLEGGIRVPFLMSWPGVIPKGLIYQYPVSSLDIVPTACASAGIKSIEPTDGVDIIPYLHDNQNPAVRPPLYWRWSAQSAIIKYPWKYIQLGTRDHFLFNLETDGNETENLVLRHPQITAEMQNDFQAWNNQLPKPVKEPALGLRANEAFAKALNRWISVKLLDRWLYSASSKVAFGTSQVGTSGRTRVFSITNHGPTAIKRLFIQSRGDAANDFQVSPRQLLNLKPGETATVNVTFLPNASGLRSSTLTVRSPISNSVFSPIDITLTGWGARD
jgi:arylsulfatase A-like enzyme